MRISAANTFRIGICDPCLGECYNRNVKWGMKLLLINFFSVHFQFAMQVTSDLQTNNVYRRFREFEDNRTLYSLLFADVVLSGCSASISKPSQYRNCNNCEWILILVQGMFPLRNEIQSLTNYSLACSRDQWIIYHWFLWRDVKSTI